MLRELIDTALLDDFVEGIARASHLRILAYDAAHRLITASTWSDDPLNPPPSPPRELAFQPLAVSTAGDEPPSGLGVIEHGGQIYVLAPVVLNEVPVGFVAVGEIDEQPGPARTTTGASTRLATAAADLRSLSTLRETQQPGVSRAIVTVRWASRLLSAWCRRESRMHAAAEELSLVGDIAELISGEQELQTILDHIVADTARVMKCRAASLRLYEPHTDELKTAAVYNLSQQYLNKGAVVRGENTIDDEALRGTLVYVEDFANDPRIRYPEEARQEGIVSGLTAGLIYRDRPVGVIRVYTDRKQRFRSMQRNLLRAVASQAATAIVHAQLMSERLRKAEMERQLKLAGQVQWRMIRTPRPDHPALDTDRVFEPSSHVGGDYCDFITLADGRLAAVVADVAGKGVPASLLMASVRGALRATGQFCTDLGEMLTRLNQHVYHETASNEFVTMLLIAVNERATCVEYCSAGHEPLLLLRDGVVQHLYEGALVLGVDPDEAYKSRQVELRPSDFLLMYTDGVIEAMNFEKQVFGRERLDASLAQHAGPSPPTTLQNILWDIRRFTGLAEQSDDITMIGLRVR